jgi:hypothetical protein
MKLGGSNFKSYSSQKFNCDFLSHFLVCLYCKAYKYWYTCLSRGTLCSVLDVVIALHLHSWTSIGNGDLPTLSDLYQSFIHSWREIAFAADKFSRSIIPGQTMQSCRI